MSRRKLAHCLYLIFHKKINAAAVTLLSGDLPPHHLLSENILTNKNGESSAVLNSPKTFVFPEAAIYY
jgi:hypothetical protein